MSSIIRRLVLLLTIFALTATVTARARPARLTNGDRLARGLPLAAPKRLFDPTRVDSAKRGGPSPDPGAVTVGKLGAVVVTDPERRKRSQLDERQSTLSYSYYLAQNPNPQAGPYVTTSASSGVTLQYVQPADESDLVDLHTVSSSSVYLGTCAGPSASWISSTSANAISFTWYYKSTGVGGAGATENCAVQTTIFTVDEDAQGEVTVHFVNSQDQYNYPPGTPLPPEYPEAFVLVFNGALYITGNVELASAALVAKVPTAPAPQQVILYIDV